MSSFQVSTHCHPSVSHDLTLWPPRENNSGSATGRSHGLKPQLSPPGRCLHGWLLGEGSCAELKKLPAALCYLWAGSSRSASAGASLILTLPSSSYVRLHTPRLVSSCSGWLFFQERVHQLSQLRTRMVPAPTATHFKAKALAANNKMSKWVKLAIFSWGGRSLKAPPEATVSLSVLASCVCYQWCWQLDDKRY